MKLFKSLQSGIAALAVIALMCFASQAHAQYKSVTVSISQQDFKALYSYGVIPVKQITSVQYISNGPGGGVAPWPPVYDPPCPDAEGMTPELAQEMTDLANQYCHDVYMCVQEEDCGWYMYVFKPTSFRCHFTVAYQSSLQAYAY